MRAAEGEPLVAVLAAGLASRFGGGKLDADCAGRPLGRWAIDAVAQAGLQPGVILVGPQPPAFASAAQGWDMITNPTPERGLGTSVALACREAARQLRAVLLLLADMPLVDADQLHTLASCPTTAATRYPDGHLGVPVHIAPGDVGRFTELSGDSGVGKLLYSLDGLTVLDAPPESLCDVDDAEALEAVRQILAVR